MILSRPRPQAYIPNTGRYDPAMIVAQAQAAIRFKPE
jgi:hypothetical protein